MAPATALQLCSPPEPIEWGQRPITCTSKGAYRIISILREQFLSHWPVHQHFVRHSLEKGSSFLRVALLRGLKMDLGQDMGLVGSTGALGLTKFFDSLTMRAEETGPTGLTPFRCARSVL